MKRSELSFIEGFISPRGEIARSQNAIFKAFDWDKAAAAIRLRFAEHPDLVAEAGLQGDWDYTGGVIFENGKPNSDSYTYLASNWATPTLILSWDGEEQEEYDCFTQENERFKSGSKWDKKSLAILKAKLLKK